MFKEIKEFGQVIKELISEQIAKLKTFDVYVITDINENDYTVNIKHPTNNTLQYSNVKISSMCLGNFKGIMCFPSVDDYVLVGFLGDRSPIIIGNVFRFTLRSPSTSLISFTSSLTAVNPKANNAGIIIILILFNAAPANKNVNPRINAIIKLPTKGIPLNQIL